MRLPTIVTALAILLAGCRDSSLEHSVARDFNIVLITLDTTRADRLGAYGYDAARTPVLDRLAREGILFESAISPVPITLPSHASILTGRDPPHHGVHHNGQYHLEASSTTLAEILEGEGYQTAAFVSAFVLDRRYGLSQGFDVYDDRVEPLSRRTVGGLDSQRSATDVTDAALSWLADREGEATFFLWVHYYDPHLPYSPPESFPRSYDGEIAYMDSQIGRLVVALEPAADRTLWIVVGDHGEGLGEHGETGHSRLLYRETQQVPWILWSPSLFRGRVREDLVGLVDVLPTALDLLGLEPPADLDGVSVNISAVESRVERFVYMETMATYLDNGWAPLYGLRARDETYILAPTREYYDLSEDPEEKRNLYPTGDAQRLENTMNAIVKDNPSIVEVAAGIRELEDEELERLQSLGYLGSSRPTAPGDPSVLPDPKDMMSVMILLAQAEELRRGERFDEALERAGRARKGAPHDLQVMQELGVIYAQTGRLDDAAEILMEYLESKDNPDVSLLLASVLRETGRAADGRAVVNEAIERHPDHGALRITLGYFLAEAGQPQEALERYREAKEVDPYRAGALADQRIVELRTRESRH